MDSSGLPINLAGKDHLKSGFLETCIRKTATGEEGGEGKAHCCFPLAASFRLASTSRPCHSPTPQRRQGIASRSRFARHKAVSGMGAD